MIFGSKSRIFSESISILVSCKALSKTMLLFEYFKLAASKFSKEYYAS